MAIEMPQSRMQQGVLKGRQPAVVPNRFMVGQEFANMTAH
jgi:hypothetical protein